MVTTSMATGGIQSVVRDLSEELVARGNRVGVVSICGTDAVETGPGVLRWSFGLPRLAGNMVQAVRRLLQVIAEFEPDVVHSHAFHANLVAQTATWGKKKPPCVKTIHSVREGGAIHRVISRGMELSGPSSVAVSRAVASAHGLDSGAHIIYNAIDLERFAFSADSRVHVRRDLGLGASDRLVVSVGRLTPAKDFRTLIAAAVRACDMQPHLHLAIVGDGPLKEELSAQIERSNASSRIRMLGARPDVPALLSAADLYVQSSAWEGFPLAPIEAMASGLKVLATDVGGTGELRPLPVLLRPRDVYAMENALRHAERYVRSDSERRGSAALLGHYSLDTLAQEWVDEYERVRME